MQAQIAITPETLQIEAWQTVALSSNGAGLAVLELWDSSFRTVCFNNGAEVGGIIVGTSGQGASLPFLAAQAGYNVSTKGIPSCQIGKHTANGLGGCIKNIGTVPISFNTAGTGDGSGPFGLEVSAGRGPNVLGPRLLLPDPNGQGNGDVLYFGVYFDPEGHK